MTDAQANDDEIIACIDHYPPYQVLGKVPHGIHITGLKQLAAVLSKQLVFIEAPNFARCIKMLELGQVDVIAGLNINKERKKIAFYAPFKRDDDHVFISSQNDVVKVYADLTGKIIGVPRGTTYFKKFESDKSLTKISIQNVDVGIELLLKKRIDVIITSKRTADSLLSQIIKENLVSVAIKPQADKPFMSYFGFSKRNRLNLSKEEIITLTTAAFKQGVFKD